MRSRIFSRTVGYWPLQEDSGQALDYSGNENHASSTSVSSYGAFGPVGSSAMDFNGSDDFVDTSLNFDKTDFTYSAWVYPRSVADVHDIVDSYETNSEEWARIGINGGNFIFSVDNNGQKLRIESNAETGSWYYIVGVKEGQQMKLYVNSELAASGTHPETGTVEGLQSERIGARTDGNTIENFDGRIAHVRVWDYPLPEASIRALYNASSGGFSQSDNKTL